jgi:hypothetical protein
VLLTESLTTLPFVLGLAIGIPIGLIVLGIVVWVVWKRRTGHQVAEDSPTKQAKKINHTFQT